MFSLSVGTLVKSPEHLPEETGEVTRSFADGSVQIEWTCPASVTFVFSSSNLELWSSVDQQSLSVVGMVSNVPR